jgi:transglutaminase-like putative cysteine protease
MVDSWMSMKRLGQATEVQSSAKTWETPDGALLRIESTMKMSAQETRTVCTFDAGKVTIETTVMGKTRSVSKDVPAGMVGPIRAADLARPLSGTTGQTVEVTTFLTEVQGAVTTKSVSKGAEKVKLADGSEASLTRIESTMAMASGAPLPMSPVSWADAKGEALRTELRVGGILVETFRVADEAAARADTATKEAAPDVFAATVLMEDGPIPVPRRLEAATIEVRLRRKGAALPAIADKGHEVTVKEDGNAVVRSVRRTPASGKEGTRPLASPAADVAEFLASSSMVQADAPEVAAIAKEIAGAQPNAWKAAQQLERWVFDSITKKNMNVAFASALEVCKSREGDCTEHSVLLAALCRAAGIPSRVAMGFEYLAGIWGGHAWTEVWIEGDWYPLDATNGLGYVDPLHLPTARLSMKDGAGEEFIQLLAGMGDIEIDVVEVVRGGRTIAVDDPALVTTADGTHTDRVLGISYRLPEGWKLDPPKRAAGLSVKVMEIDGRTAEGKDVEIEISLMDAPAGLEWTKLFGDFGVAPETAKEAKLDGRDARRIERTRGTRSEVRVVAADGGALWMFVLDRADGETERKAFDAFLASVDLDVK